MIYRWVVGMPHALIVSEHETLHSEAGMGIVGGTDVGSDVPPTMRHFPSDDRVYGEWVCIHPESSIHKFVTIIRLKVVEGRVITGCGSTQWVYLDECKWADRCNYFPVGHDGLPVSFELRNEELEAENERLQRWKTMLEAAPGEAREIIRSRCLQGHYIQPIIAEWKTKVHSLQVENGSIAFRLRIAQEQVRRYVDANQRLHDLVRYKRSELHTDGLISDDEYAELAKDHPAVDRLEGYDAMKRSIARLEKAAADAVSDRDAVATIRLRAEPKRVFEQFYKSMCSECAAGIFPVERSPVGGYAYSHSYFHKRGHLGDYRCGAAEMRRAVYERYGDTGNAETQLLIRCHDCGGTVVYKTTADGYEVFHSCKDGKQVTEMVEKLQSQLGIERWHGRQDIIDMFTKLVEVENLDLNVVRMEFRKITDKDPIATQNEADRRKAERRKSEFDMWHPCPNCKAAVYGLDVNKICGDCDGSGKRERRSKERRQATPEVQQKGPAQ